MSTEMRVLFRAHCDMFAAYFAEVRRYERRILEQHAGPLVGQKLLYWPFEMLVDVANALRSDIVAKLSQFGYRLHDETLRFSLFPRSPYKSISMDSPLDVEALHLDVAIHVYVTHVLRKSAK